MSPISTSWLLDFSGILYVYISIYLSIYLYPSSVVSVLSVPALRARKVGHKKVRGYTLSAQSGRKSVS